VLGVLDSPVGCHPGCFAAFAVIVEVRGHELWCKHAHIPGRLTDHAVLDRTTFGLVAGQQALAAPALEHGGQLPAQVDRVADAGVQPVPAERRVQVRRVTREENPPDPQPVDQLHPRGPGVGRQDRRIHGCADGPVDEPVRVTATVPLAHAEGDDPPGPGRVEGAHEGGCDVVDDPVVHGRTVPDQTRELWRREHHAEVRPQCMLPAIVDADLVTHRAARAVTAHDVVRSDDRGPAALRADLDLDRGVVLLEGDHPQAGGQRAGRQILDGFAEHLLQNVLRCLLAGLREPVALRGEPQDAVEPGQLTPGQGGAEDDVLRPRSG
jgi:hypothetical protein